MDLDAAKARIAQLEDKIRGMVPKERLDSKNETIAKIEAERDEARAKLADAPDPSKAEKRYQRLEAKLAEVQSEYDGAKQQWSTSQALTAAGITDPDDQDIVLHRYGKLGEGAPALTDWLGSDEGAKADKVLTRILGGGGEGEQQQSQTGRPNSNGGAKHQIPGKAGSLEEFSKLPPAFRVSDEGRQLYSQLVSADRE